jgi:hypothetical protein
LFYPLVFLWFNLGGKTTTKQKTETGLETSRGPSAFIYGVFFFPPLATFIDPDILFLLDGDFVLRQLFVCWNSLLGLKYKGPREKLV